MSTTALNPKPCNAGEGALDTAILRDRIYRAGGPDLAASAPAPPFPFVAEEVSGEAAGGLPCQVSRPFSITWEALRLRLDLTISSRNAQKRFAGCNRMLCEWRVAGATR